MPVNGFKDSLWHDDCKEENRSYYFGYNPFHCFAFRSNFMCSTRSALPRSPIYSFFDLICFRQTASTRFWISPWLPWGRRFTYAQWLRDECFARIWHLPAVYKVYTLYLTYYWWWWWCETEINPKSNLWLGCTPHRISRMLPRMWKN